jgi:hypothetical protein
MSDSVIYCSIVVRDLCLPSSDWAAWVQAVGAITALAATYFFSSEERRARSKADDEAALRAQIAVQIPLIAVVTCANDIEADISTGGLVNRENARGFILASNKLLELEPQLMSLPFRHINEAHAVIWNCKNLRRALLARDGADAEERTGYPDGLVIGICIDLRHAADKLFFGLQLGISKRQRKRLYG